MSKIFTYLLNSQGTGSVPERKDCDFHPNIGWTKQERRVSAAQAQLHQ